jgi:hypothetical protein
MYIDFSLLPDHARLWVYQANRQFTLTEAQLIRENAHAFCDQWTAHGEPLKTSFRIERNQFLVLAVDEDFNGASGCSIDGSVRMLKAVQDRLGIDFFDRSKVAVLVGDEVTMIPLTGLKEAFSNGTLGTASLTFNVQATSKGTWERDWIVAAGKTWLSRYLTKSSVA